jgi:chemotaxis protein methyltransferase CheR
VTPGDEEGRTAVAQDPPAFSMRKREFDALRELIYAQSGITLGEHKQALVVARVGKRMRELRLETHAEYVDHVQRRGQDEVVHLLDAISTNVTSFLREPIHFELLAQVFARWLAGGQRRFRLWSAACSSGEEPYSMAMTLVEAAGDAAVDLRILATDISTLVLEQAVAGVYRKERVGPIPAQLRQRYFEPARADGSELAVTAALRRLVVFRRLNLSQPLPMHGPLDVIFLRNAMIYFDHAVRQRLVSECHRLLRPEGYLVVGHAENLTGLASGFRAERPSVYVKS